MNKNFCQRSSKPIYLAAPPLRRSPKEYCINIIDGEECGYTTANYGVKKCFKCIRPCDENYYYYRHEIYSWWPGRHWNKQRIIAKANYLNIKKICSNILPTIIIGTILDYALEEFNGKIFKSFYNGKIPNIPIRHQLSDAGIYNIPHQIVFHIRVKKAELKWIVKEIKRTQILFKILNDSGLKSNKICNIIAKMFFQNHIEHIFEIDVESSNELHNINKNRFFYEKKNDFYKSYTN